MKILITGVKGFMATNFAEHYLNDTNYDVVGMSTDPSRAEEMTIVAGLKNRHPDRFSFHSCDITNSGRLKLILDKERPDIILNFASQATVAKSFEQPYEFYKSNLEGVVHLLEWLRHDGDETRMVQFSTEAIFATGSSKSKEDDPMWPKNPYSASKAAAEQYIFAYNFCFNTNVQIARPVNNYGPYQNPNKVIAKTIISCIKNDPPKLKPDPTPYKRHWVYVKDTCSAVDLMITKGEKTGVYNIAPEEKSTTNDVIMQVLDVFGKKPEMQKGTELSLKDQEHYELDGSKIRVLGWKPKYSLREGLNKEVEWFKSNQWFYESPNLKVSE